MHLLFYKIHNYFLSILHYLAIYIFYHTVSNITSFVFSNILDLKSTPYDASYVYSYLFSQYRNINDVLPTQLEPSIIIFIIFLF